MAFELFACDPLMGAPRLPSPGRRSDRADLLAEIARLEIGRAVVRHRGAIDCGPITGNLLVAEETAGHDLLLPCPMVTPDGEEPDFKIGATIDRLIGTGARSCWIDPDLETFSLQPWCAGALYDVLSQRRMPLLLNYRPERMDDLDAVLGAYPELMLILLEAPRLGRNRMIYPLLERHANLVLCLSHSYSVVDGIEDLCRTFGHERWVFGTGYPDAESGAAVAGLAYAEVSDEARSAIGSGNLERLLARVQ